MNGDGLGGDLGWDVYLDQGVEHQVVLGSEVGRRVLTDLLDNLCEHGPKINGARQYPRPLPSTLWRAPIAMSDRAVYGAAEYVEESHQRIRVTWIARLPGR